MDTIMLLQRTTGGAESGTGFIGLVVVFLIFLVIHQLVKGNINSDVTHPTNTKDTFYGQELPEQDDLR